MKSNKSPGCDGFTSELLKFFRKYIVVSSPELKAQVSFSDQNLSVVRRRCHCRCHCRKLLTFSSSFPVPNFNQTWHKASLGEWDSSLFE